MAASHFVEVTDKGNEGICDLFTEARCAEVNKHISPRCLKLITYLFFTLRGRVNESE
jgi:hypothetical protein